MKTAWGIMLVSVLIIAMSVTSASSARFTVDPSGSSLVLQLFRDGLAARLGHDHVVEARRFIDLVARP